jgi:hypothetical protein
MHILITKCINQTLHSLETHIGGSSTRLLLLLA